MPVMRVVLITQGLNAISKWLVNDPRTVGVVESGPRTQLSSPTSWRRPNVRQLLKRTSILRTRALKEGIPYFWLTKEKSDDFASWLRERAPDVVVVYSMSHLLPSAVLDVPGKGTINLHPSLLPEWRGPNPWPWVYLSNAETSGYTLHFLDEGEDTGDVISQVRFEVPRSTPANLLALSTLRSIGLPLIQGALAEIEEGHELPRVKQPSGSPTPRARRLCAEELCELIDWRSWPPDQIRHCLGGFPHLLAHLVGTPSPPSGRWLVADEPALRRVGKWASEVSFESLNGRPSLVFRDWAIPLRQESLQETISRFKNSFT